jgi:GST-like protein
VLKKDKAEDAKYRALQRDPELLAFHSQATAGDGLPEATIQAAEQRLHGLFQKADATLGQHRWLVGDEFSLADISWVPLHFTLIGAGFPFERYPHVASWADAIRQRPSFHDGVLRWCAKF